MKVLITSAAQRLPQAIAAALSHEHEVRLTDRQPVTTEHTFVTCDLGPDLATNKLVKGTDAIVHWGQVQPSRDVSDQFDFLMRCTYNLLWAATDEQVPRMIVLSSLRLFERYEEHFQVSEQWRPSPSTDPVVLGSHLCEYVAKEFARERKVEVVCLRLGTIIWPEHQGALPTAALTCDDAAQAVERALHLKTRPSDTKSTGSDPWRIFHIQSSVANARYPTTMAQRQLHFEPSQYN